MEYSDHLLDTPFDEWQDNALSSEDGRFYGIDQWTTKTRIVQNYEQVGKEIVQFGLPSAPALFLGLAHEAFILYKDADLMKIFDHPSALFPQDHRALFNFFGQFTAHVVFAYTALEAWVNENIPDGYVYTKTMGRPGTLGTYTGPEIERFISLSEKLSDVIPPLLNVESPKGRAIWREFVKLEDMRDRVIHLKAADRHSSKAHIKTIWGDMLRTAKEPFCDYVHELIGHYGPTTTDRRWYHKYPYASSLIEQG